MRRQRILFSGALLALAGWASGQAQNQTQEQAQLELCEAVGTFTHNRDGSYFYSSELRYGADTDGVTQWMKRLDETLRADGTLLVAVPTPTRGMVSGVVVTDTAALETLQIDFRRRRGDRLLSGLREVARAPSGGRPRAVDAGDDGSHPRFSAALRPALDARRGANRGGGDGSGARYEPALRGPDASRADRVHDYARRDRAGRKRYF